MNVKILNLFLIISVLIISSGCQGKTIYLDKIVEVGIPIKCITPNVICEYKNNMTYTEVLNELRRCNKELIKANEVCKQ